MTQTTPSARERSSKPELGAFGVFGHYTQFQNLTPEQLRDIEALGYGAIWAGGSPPADLDWVEPLLAPTEEVEIQMRVVCFARS